MGGKHTVIGRVRRSDGSMTVEAAMILPFFLLVVLFLIFIVQMSLYSTALQSMVSDTVKVVSSHMYPVYLAVQEKAGGTAVSGQGEPADELSRQESGGGGEDGIDADRTAEGRNGEDRIGESKTGEGRTRDGWTVGRTGEGKTVEGKTGEGWTVPRLPVADVAGQLAEALPQPIGRWLGEAVQGRTGALEQLETETSEAVLDPLIKPLLLPNLSAEMLEEKRIHVSNIMIPDLKKGTKPFFGLSVSYELPMKVPFLNRKIVLEASAIERIWIGETDSPDTGQGGGETGGDSITVLEKPNPGYPGRQGTIRAKGEPGCRAQLTVIYKSGTSKAKYLGWAEADGGGIIEWNWKIGTNTTPGEWRFVIETDDGRSVEAEFTVAPARGG